MAEVMRIEGDVFVAGELSSQTMGIPSATVVNDDVAAAAAIVASKLEHQFAKVVCQESGTTCTDETYVAHVGYGATGTIVSFKCGVITACVGAATIAVDLLKNGVSILNSAATINSNHSARELVTGTISTSAYVTGDVLEIDFNETTGGGTQGKGVFAEVVLQEDAA
jgi:hypothetical protein